MVNRIASHRSFARPWRHAFTMIEIMIVVAVIAILSAAAVPMLSATEHTKLRSAASIVLADLEFAQTESIANPATPRSVVFTTSTSTWNIITGTAPGTTVTNPIDKQPYSTKFGIGRAASLSGVTISSVSLGTGNAVQFGGLGQTNLTNTGTVTLSCNSRTITLSIDPTTGEVSVGNIN